MSTRISEKEKLLLGRIGVLNQEIERLNNIINELEQWLNKWKSFIDNPDEFEDGIINCIVDTLDKIKELKGSDSNESR